MSDQYVSELRLFPYGFAPKGWAYCDGSALSVAQNQALYALIGNTFGGGGTSFNLPDLRGRAALGAGKSADGITYERGQRGGEAAHTFTNGEIPPHNHELLGTSDDAQTAVSPAGTFLGGAVATAYAPPGGGEVVQLDPGALVASPNEPHPNMQPYTTLTWCIALVGLYPSPN